MNKKIWAGRFSQKTAPLMEKFSHSLDIDIYLYSEDLAVNRAWAEALNQIGIFSDQEKDKVISSLDLIEKEFENGKFSFSDQDEDIHSAIERRLIELTGDIGGNIHAGRSRNDQVATDLLLYLRRRIDDITCSIRKLAEVIVDIAEANKDVIMPGYTHLQRAQPILFSHYCMSLFWLLERDSKRLGEAKKRCGILPLGSGALAGSGFQVDRGLLAKILGFEQPSNNSIDATAHRDIPTEVAFVSTLIIIHLSQYVTDLILWSSREFNFVTIDEAYATGSSIMPQKKNPDSLELVRGKATTSIGHLTGFLSLCQGLPHAYNRDLQEDKKHIHEIIDIAQSSLEIFTGVLKTLKINKEAMTSALTSDLLATELADYLTCQGMRFRKAHQTVGHIVKWTEEQSIALNEIPLSKLKEFSPYFDKQVYEWLDFKNAIRRHDLYGGTGTKSLEKQLVEAKTALKNF